MDKNDEERSCLCMNHLASLRVVAALGIGCDRVGFFLHKCNGKF
ncbi:hypothetical protein [Bartonella massiliensis]|nr:hypothetical protein [Bartonella massiliensis]